MVSGPELYAIVLILAVAPALWVARLSWQKRDRVAGRWLTLLLVSMAGWSLCWAGTILFESLTLTLASANLVLLCANVASAGWLMVTVEYSNRKRYPNIVLGPFLVMPVVTQALAWTNPLHQSLWGPATLVDARGVLYADQQLWFFVHAVYSFGLIFAGLVLLVRSLFRFDGIYRRQTAVLLVGAAIPCATSLVFTAGLLPVPYLNPTPIAFIVGASIFGWGLYRYRLFEIVPIARRTAYDVMDEAVITVDDRGAVADVNVAAREMFELDEDPVDRPVTDVLGIYPAVVEAYRAGRTSETIAIETGTDYEYLTLDQKAIINGDRSIGTVLVFKNVTALKRHENELELLKQVFGRVFRHDLSNDLNVIRARGELLAHESAAAETEHARTVIDKCDDIIETSKKARAIETLVEADRPRHHVEIGQVVSDAVAWARERYPHASITVETPDRVWAYADGKLELAVRSVIENGIVHNDGKAPALTIEIRRTETAVTISVEDDGPGINPEETEILETREINQLQHSSGLGLWLLYWAVRNSEGDVEITNTGSGALVVMTLERVRDPSTTD